jgi:hypothetical protein
LFAGIETLTDLVDVFYSELTGLVKLCEFFDLEQWFGVSGLEIKLSYGFVKFIMGV